MCILKLSVALILLSVALNHLKATPIESNQVEKRKCTNTATCATQRLANFLVRSSNHLGAMLSPTYGKRSIAEVLNRVPMNYLPL
ncbi:PREDICTED: LOW QUALITY PROTEIN: islet amyloid polypeptide [Chrysochloris asiatica]|uniref:Islet amyloid polypeptide n=1 Tax=Chrysochloris asiatica TaxID=185453 RepID=A0A9B0TSL2_CHRAS|nr:PREDICTED: LOW QUALITY PROTEIN: islet amyloid polypeptide [Chrysochloris asiatica]